MAKRGELQGQVESCLRRFPKTRNSDVELTIRIWKEYFSQRIIEREKDGKEYVAIRDLFDLPREDNVKRIRAKFQNDFGRYLPTSLEVVKQRRINEGEWREYMRKFPIEDTPPQEIKKCPHGLPLQVNCPNCV
jgi:hypothetical protein